MARQRFLSDNVRTALKPFAAFLLFVLVILLLRRLPYTGSIITSVQSGMASVGAAIGHSVSRLVASDTSLSALLKTCQDDKSILARDAVEYARLQEENQELRSALEYKEMSNREGVTARIIARTIPDEASRVELDKGQADGILPGSTVVVGQGMVFGVITAVNQNTSVATLLTSSDSKITASILGKRKTAGLVEGRDGSVLSMQFIPRDSGITRGDVVVTSGLEGQIPEGLMLGTVTEVTDMPSAPFEEALVEPLEDPLAWSMVLILPPA